MDYRTVFDIAATEYRVPGGAFVVLMFVCIGLWMVLSEHLDDRRGFAWFFFGFSLLAAFFVLHGTCDEHRTLVRALKYGDVKVTTGAITEVRPRTSFQRGSPSARFCIDRTCFSYGHATGGFDASNLRPGILREGRQVRVTSYKGTIVRMEIGP